VAESDPKYSIEGRQNGLLTFSLEGRELQPQGSIFDGDGLVTAQQESDESKDRQQKGWHVLRLFGSKPFQVNLLRADAIMANDRIPKTPYGLKMQVFASFLRSIRSPSFRGL
jgi:hypothetical protein